MTHFSWYLDGSIVAVYLAATMLAGVMVRKYVGSVDHFLIAGREMNTYLGIASLAATEFGVVTCMYAAQNGYSMGFSGVTSGILTALAMLLVGWTGFCINPLRNSNVMTLPELFESRFGPRIRWAAGLVIVLGGLLNMGPFLRAGGEFLLLVCDLPLSATPTAASGTLAAFVQSHTLELCVTVLLVLMAAYTILGGMLSVLVTDFLQFVVMSAGLIAVSALILTSPQIGWEKLVASVQEHHGAGGFNPLMHDKMGWPYVVFFALVALSGVLTWQTMIQRVLAARDTAVGRKIYARTAFFFVCRFLLPGLWGMAALAMLTKAQTPENTLYAMPRFMGLFVPSGLMGLLMASMLAAEMSSGSSYMLTWAGVIYNDLLTPFGKNRWTQRQGLAISRLIVLGIGLFLAVYGLWYPLRGDLWTYLGVTGSIYLTSMSVLLIACCYWPQANDWGAAAAIFLGAAVPVAYLVLELALRTKTVDAAGIEVVHSVVDDKIGPYYSGIAAYVAAALGMIVGSLLKTSGKTVEGNAS